VASRRRRIGIAVGTLILGAGAALYGVTRVPPAQSCHIDGRLPDTSAQCTPGALNPKVTQNTIDQTICSSGYTKTIRPKTTYTTPLERDLLKTYGLRLQPAATELDHFIPLELGGNPTDIRNLWPQPYQPLPGAKEKDWLENHLKAEVCAGTITLAAAQDMIRTDWAAAYKRLHP
jgi:hypothetical protein